MSIQQMRREILSIKTEALTNVFYEIIDKHPELKEEITESIKKELKQAYSRWKGYKE